MGCASTKSGVVNSQKKKGGKEGDASDKSDRKGSDYDGDDEESEFVAVEEAVEFVIQELAINRERAKKMVLSVSKGDETKVSCVDLVLLNERIKEIKETLAPKFEAYDPDGTGHVTPETAVAIVMSEFEGMPESNVRSLVERFDEDGNNQVDFCEFIEFYAFVKSKKGDLEGKFDHLDKDNSGDLDAEELIQMLMDECSIKEGQARSLVSEFDKDNNGTLDKTEFMTMWFMLFG